MTEFERLDKWQQKVQYVIGILDLDAFNVEEPVARAISDRLRVTLAEYPLFLIVERSKMTEIFEEVGFQFTGICRSDECVIQVGKILGASMMVAGSVSQVGRVYTLQVRLIDIETGRIEAQAISDVDGLEAALMQSTVAVSRELANRIGSTDVPNTGNLALARNRVETGQFRILSKPDSAEILVDGVRTGQTPGAVILSEGQHTIRLDHIGHESRVKHVEVIPGSQKTVRLRLLPVLPRNGVRIGMGITLVTNRLDFRYSSLDPWEEIALDFVPSLSGRLVLFTKSLSALAGIEVTPYRRVMRSSNQMLLRTHLTHSLVYAGIGFYRRWYSLWIGSNWTSWDSNLFRESQMNYGSPNLSGGISCRIDNYIFRNVSLDVMIHRMRGNTALQDFSWVHVQSSTVKQDGHPEVLPVPIASRPILDLLDLGVQ